MGEIFKGRHNCASFAQHQPERRLDPAGRRQPGPVPVLYRRPVVPPRPQQGALMSLIAHEAPGSGSPWSLPARCPLGCSAQGRGPGGVCWQGCLPALEPALQGRPRPTCASPFQVVIPFFSLLIKDIYFLSAGCASRLPKGHSKFEARSPSPPRVTEGPVGWDKWRPTWGPRYGPLSGDAAECSSAEGNPTETLVLPLTESTVW
nr:uncharacterized protein LOC109729748 [Microcebus murinus]